MRIAEFLLLVVPDNLHKHWGFVKFRGFELHFCILRKCCWCDILYTKHISRESGSSHSKLLIIVSENSCFYSKIEAGVFKPPVFEFIKYVQNKVKLKELSERDSAYMDMEEDAYEVAVAFTGAEELLAVKRKEGVNMCQALKELLQDERAEGREEETLRMTTLIQKMLYAGRSAELLRAAEDKEYLKQLCIEMQV